jgi:hypothetical protein
MEDLLDRFNSHWQHTALRMHLPGQNTSPGHTWKAQVRLAAAVRLRSAVALELVPGKVWALPKFQRPVAAAAMLARVHALCLRGHDHSLL